MYRISLEWGELIFQFSSKWLRNQQIVYGLSSIVFLIFGVICLPPLLNSIFPSNDIGGLGWMYFVGFIFVGIICLASVLTTIPPSIYRCGIVTRNSILEMIKGRLRFIPFSVIRSIYFSNNKLNGYIYIQIKNDIILIDKREFDQLQRFIEIIKIEGLIKDDPLTSKFRGDYPADSGNNKSLQNKQMFCREKEIP
jgi:hypothetical protein